MKTAALNDQHRQNMKTTRSFQHRLSQGDARRWSVTDRDFCRSGSLAAASGARPKPRPLALPSWPRDTAMRPTGVILCKPAVPSPANAPQSLGRGALASESISPMDNASTKVTRDFSDGRAKLCKFVRDVGMSDESFIKPTLSTPPRMI